MSEYDDAFAAPLPAAPGRDETVALAGETESVRLDDAHLSEWVARRALGDSWCWAAGLGWLRWDGRRWADATETAVAESVRLAVIDLHAREAGAAVPVARLRELSGLLSAHRIGSLTRLIRGIVEKPAAAFDQHPDLLNAGNGVVDLTTARLHPHDRALLLTKIAAADYRPGATHPDWDQALRAMPPDVADWMHVRFGQAATGHPTPDDVLPVLQGGGRNGKTTVTAAIRRTLGEYAALIPDRVLMSNPGDHPTELMTLRGARLAVMEETPEARHLNVKRLKDTVGTPEMTARRIRQDSVTWRATHSLMLTSNYPPRIDETDHGTWRRLALVRFPYRFDPESPGADPGLRERLAAGAEGQHAAVLAWLVDGACRWYAAGRILPGPPEQVRADTDAWRAESDVMLAFIREHLAYDPAGAVLTTEVFAAFTAHLEAVGQRPWSDQTFTGRFAGHSENERHNVTKARPITPPDVSKRDPMTTIPARPRLWLGLRWKRPGEDQQPEAKPQVDRGRPGLPGNSREERYIGGTRQPRSTPVWNPPEDHDDLPRCPVCGAYADPDDALGLCTGSTGDPEHDEYAAAVAS